MTTPSLETESGLLHALRAGEEEAFATLIENYGGRMRVTALRLLGAEDLADDAVQEAFLSAFRSIDKFQADSSLGTWLHRVVINAALAKLRANGRRRDRELEFAAPGFPPSFAPGGAHTAPQAPWTPPADEPAMQREIRTRVRACIDELPDKHRIPLLLRDLEELSNQEVAQHLEITPNACKIRVHRARQALRALLEPIFGADD